MCSGFGYWDNRCYQISKRFCNSFILNKFSFLFFEMNIKIVIESLVIKSLVILSFLRPLTLKSPLSPGGRNQEDYGEDYIC